MVSRHLSVVVPVYRNADALVELHRRVTGALDTVGVTDRELVLVDDASPDHSWATIESLARVDPNVVGVRLASNVGQIRALCAGLEVAGGDVFAIMDADLEHPPEALPDLLETFSAGHDLVIGRRIGRSSTVGRRLGSRGINALAVGVGLPSIGVGSSFLVGTPRLARAMRRIVERTGRQMVLLSVYEVAYAPTVVDVDFPFQARSSYRSRAAVHLGMEFLIAELAPRIARRLLVASLAAAAVAAVGPRRRAAVHVAAILASLSAAGAAGPRAFTRDASVPLYEIAALARVEGPVSTGTGTGAERSGTTVPAPS